MAQLDSFFAVVICLPLLPAALMIFMANGQQVGKYRSIPAIVTWNACLFSFLLTLGFASFETYYRYFVDSTESFGLSLITKRWMDRHYVLNDFGVRDNIQYDNKKLPGKRRVTFVGDSFTAGHGVENVEHRFVNRLRSSNPQKEFHSLAINGMESNNHLTIFSQIDTTYELDLVVLVYVLNDISYLSPNSKEILGRIYAYQSKLNYLEKESFFLNSLTFKLKAAQDPALTKYFEYVQSSYFSDEWNTQEQVLLNIRDVVHSRGGKLLVVTFPFLHQLGSDYAFRPVHEKLDQFWRSNGVPHLDLLSIYEGYSAQEITVNRLDAHPNQLGHEIAAREIGKFIDSNLAKEL